MKLGFVIIFFSAAALLGAILVFFAPCFSKKLNKRLRKKRIALAIGMLFVSLFSLHLFTLNRNGIAVQTILDAFLLALKTFLADGGITIEWHFSQIDETMKAIYNHEPPEKLAVCMKTIAAIGDVAAPLLTLTTVINLLSELFPKIRISFSLFREKFVFSEVNEETVVLAESIYDQFAGRIRKPMLIATDVYVDNESEKASELVERLKKIGCICIKNDILDLRVRVKAGTKLTFILSDRNKMKNLSVALELIRRFNTGKHSALKARNRVYVFNDLDEAEELLSKECKVLYQKVERLNDQHPKKKLYFLPLVVPIKEYKNAIYDLFDRFPLYMPIVGKKRTELNIAILGTGKIGTEAFLSTFWCCQMLDIKLNITILSKNAAVGFKNQLNRINKSIINAATSATPYCSIAFVSCDFKQVSFDELLETRIASDNVEYKIEAFGDVCDRLYKTDYYIVSLGDDAFNINTAYLLRRAVERAVLKGRREQDNQVIIATSVYDSAIDATVAYEDSDVRVIPFASFDSRYSYNNVINKRFITGAQNISDTYDSMSTSYSEKDMRDIYGQTEKEYNYYKYWSNVARRLHQKYAMFSVGVCAEKDVVRYVEKLRDDDLCDRLAWLEHRRWNAHLWTMGYQHFDTAKNLTEKKAHPCLVEIVPGRHHRLPFSLKEQEGEVVRVCELQSTNLAKPPYDALDRACCDFKYQRDAKQYDYPQHSEIRLTDAQMLIYCKPEAEDYYASRINADQYTYELYSAEEDERGQRVWAIFRFLLDEELMKGIARLYKENMEAIPEYLMKAYQIDRTGLMTRERVCQILKKSGLCQSLQSK